MCRKNGGVNVDMQIWILMMLSGENEDPTIWPVSLYCNYRDIFFEFYGILRNIRDKVEKMLLIDDFEPEVPLVSRMVLNPLEW
jgi:hypothetical protein